MGVLLVSSSPLGRGGRHCEASTVSLPANEASFTQRSYRAGDLPLFAHMPLTCNGWIKGSGLWAVGRRI